MPITEMTVIISMSLLMLTAFVFFLRLIQTWLLHRTLREAITRDSPMAAGLVDRIGSGDLTAPRIGSDDRTGLILLAVGIAIAGYTLIVNEAEWMRHGLGASLFPLLVGAALLVRHRWARRGDDLASGA
jgi:hypothetical protein